MLNELVEFGKRIRKPDSSDALKEEHVSIDIIIDAQGNFSSFNVHDKFPTQAEALTAKKGKARLLLDKAEEVLGFDTKKHALFLEKLKLYEQVPALLPVRLFYESNKKNGLDKASEAFSTAVPEKKQKENLAFLVLGEGVRIHEKSEVLGAVIAKFEQEQSAKNSQEKTPCSICGTTDYPVLDEPHGLIKKVPDGQPTGCAFISYNETAFESYNLKGNMNSSICTVCARNYVEGLNYLLGNGTECFPEKGKSYFQYSNRRNLARDTAMVYWTKNNTPVPELDLLENAREEKERIFGLIQSTSLATSARDSDFALILDSPFSAKTASLSSVEPDLFYSCILSGATSRIAIRSWIQTTTPIIKNNIAQWFHDSAIQEIDFDTKEAGIRFFSLRELAAACAVHRKKNPEDSKRYELDKEDDFLGKAGTILWNCALLNKKPPLTLLDRVLRRIKTEEGRVTAARAALLKFILNRTMQPSGEKHMKIQLDDENNSTAYVAGRIFAVLENIQNAALGDKLNAPIRDRFFSFASTNPAPAFGRLLKLSQHHLSKLRNEKPGLAVNLDKLLGELFCRVQEFPALFRLEEQAQFAIGYYHQRQENFTKNETKNEIK